MNAQERWKQLHQRLTELDYQDSCEEGTFEEAYSALVTAYQEARELNEEMAILTNEMFQKLQKEGVAF